MALGNSLFFELGMMFLVVAILGFILRLLKQPLIPAYILAGVVVGPVGFKLITDIDLITSLSSFGIAFLLFIVGLEFSFKRLKETGIIAFAGGFLQVSFVFFISYLVAFLFGFGHIEALYIGLFLAFSSTMVVIKLLADKKQLDTWHGKIVIGILLVQDLIVILTLPMLTQTMSFNTSVIVVSFSKLIFLLSLSYVSGTLILPTLFKFASRSQEMLLISSLAVAFAFSFFADYLGLFVGMGAFVAGLTLARLPYSLEIIGQVRSLSTFFLTIFFVSLGMNLVFDNISSLVVPFLILLGLTIVAKPLVLMVMMSVFGYKKKPSFLTAISLAQTSEFSLVLAAQGVAFGHISSDLYIIVILLAITTMTLTTYFIKYESFIFSLLSKPLSIFEKLSKHHRVLDNMGKKVKYDVLLAGYGKIGFDLLHTLRKMKHKTLIVDFDPDVIKKLTNARAKCIYGDITDSEVIERLELSRLKMFISSISSVHDNLFMIRKLRSENKSVLIIVTASNVDDALLYYKESADYVILPSYLGGKHTSFLLEGYGNNLKKFFKLKVDHLRELKKHIGRKSFK